MDGSATKSQPPAGREIPSGLFGNSALSNKFLIRRSVIGIATQELPSQVTRRQIVDVFIGGLRPPAIIFGHPPPPPRNVMQRELCSQYDSRLNGAGEERRCLYVLQLVHHVSSIDLRAARKSRSSSSTSRGQGEQYRRCARGHDLTQRRCRIGLKLFLASRRLRHQHRGAVHTASGAPHRRRSTPRLLAARRESRLSSHRPPMMRCIQSGGDC